MLFAVYGRMIDDFDYVGVRCSDPGLQRAPSMSQCRLMTSSFVGNKSVQTFLGLGSISSFFVSPGRCLVFSRGIRFALSPSVSSACVARAVVGSSRPHAVCLRAYGQWRIGRHVSTVTSMMVMRCADVGCVPALPPVLSHRGRCIAHVQL
jgi:hypothetical protein